MADKNTTKTGVLRGLNQAQLRDMLSQARERVRQSRFDVASGNTKSISSLRTSRKLVARLLTLMRNP